MNKWVNITILSARNFGKTGELFATVGAILWNFCNPLVHSKNTVKYLVSNRLESLHRENKNKVVF